MTTPSESATDRLAEIRARVESRDRDGTLSYGDDWRWLLERLGVEGLVAKLADENCRAAEVEAERLRGALQALWDDCCKPDHFHLVALDVTTQVRAALGD